MQLTNKVAVVTGAARGLGRAYVEALAAEGAAVVAADLNDCSDSVAAVEAAGGQAIAATVDVADGDSCQNMAELAMQAFGRVDILINNAALYAGLKGARFEQLDEDQWDRVMRVNIKGTWLTSRAVVGHMRASGGGSIINMSSVVGVKGNAGQANYAASKAGMIGFTKSVALELGSRNIRCNAIAPGFIETEMTEKLDEKTVQGWRDAIPLKRGGTPEDVANACLYLASDLSAYVTGQVLHVDGGMLT